MQAAALDCRVPHRMKKSKKGLGGGRSVLSEGHQRKEISCRPGWLHFSDLPCQFCCKTMALPLCPAAMHEPPPSRAAPSCRHTRKDAVPNATHSWACKGMSRGTWGQIPLPHPPVPPPEQAGTDGQPEGPKIAGGGQGVGRCLSPLCTHLQRVKAKAESARMRKCPRWPCLLLPVSLQPPRRCSRCSGWVGFQRTREGKHCST